jgi:NAD(P)-dependent dehydrogenase (short-subunit alcohol dehydrogenase family)
LLKSAAIEWPGLSARTIDFADDESAEIIAQRVLDELSVRDEAIEISYRGGQRVRHRMKRAARNPDSVRVSRATSPSSDWVILASGGLSGITAEILVELSLPNLTLVVLGRSPEPDHETRETSELTDAAALRRHFFEVAARNATNESPRNVEARVQRLLRQREMRNNAERLRARGVHLAYFSCDVRDEQSVKSVLAEARARFGRFDALVHGAGVIEDASLADKGLASFDRVFDTKVDGAYLLMRELSPAELKLAVFFGSVSGRVGNPGQTDYAAANEVLNRLGSSLRHRFPHTRFLTINWGPWSGVGMATASVQARLRDRGILPIDPASGARFFREELREDSLEVLAGEGPWADECPLAPSTEPPLRSIQPPSGIIERSGHPEVALVSAEE